MKNLKATKALFLICLILAITSVVSPYDGFQATHIQASTTPRWTNPQNSPIITSNQNKESMATPELSCISANPNIFKILQESKEHCQGQDYRVTFYLQTDDEYTKLNSFFINKYLFHNLLMKYTDWSLTSEKLRPFITKQTTKCDNKYIDKATVQTSDHTKWPSSVKLTNNCEDKRPKAIDDTCDCFNYQGTANTKFDTQLNINQGKTVIKNDEKYATTTPKYNAKYQRYEVSLPKYSDTTTPRTINVYIDKNIKSNHDEDTDIITNYDKERRENRSKDQNTVCDRVKDHKISEIIDALFNDNINENKPIVFDCNGKDTDIVNSDVVNIYVNDDTTGYKKEIDDHFNNIDTDKTFLDTDNGRVNQGPCIFNTLDPKNNYEYCTYTNGNRIASSLANTDGVQYYHYNIPKDVDSQETDSIKTEGTLFHSVPVSLNANSKLTLSPKSLNDLSFISTVQSSKESNHLLLPTTKSNSPLPPKYVWQEYNFDTIPCENGNEKSSDCYGQTFFPINNNVHSQELNSFQEESNNYSLSNSIVIPKLSLNSNLNPPFITEKQEPFYTTDKMSFLDNHEEFLMTPYVNYSIPISTKNTEVSNKSKLAGLDNVPSDTEIVNYLPNDDIAQKETTYSKTSSDTNLAQTLPNEILPTVFRDSEIAIPKLTLKQKPVLNIISSKITSEPHIDDYRAKESPELSPLLDETTIYHMLDKTPFSSVTTPSLSIDNSRTMKPVIKMSQLNIPQQDGSLQTIISLPQSDNNLHLPVVVKNAEPATVTHVNPLTNPLAKANIILKAPKSIFNYDISSLPLQFPLHLNDSPFSLINLELPSITSKLPPPNIKILSSCYCDKLQDALEMPLKIFSSPDSNLQKYKSPTIIAAPKSNTPIVSLVTEPMTPLSPPHTPMVTIDPKLKSTLTPLNMANQQTKIYPEVPNTMQSEIISTSNKEPFTLYPILVSRKKPVTRVPEAIQYTNAIPSHISTRYVDLSVHPSIQSECHTKPILSPATLQSNISLSFPGSSSINIYPFNYENQIIKDTFETKAAPVSHENVCLQKYIQPIENRLSSISYMPTINLPVVPNPTTSLHVNCPDTLVPKPCIPLKSSPKTTYLLPQSLPILDSSASTSTPTTLMSNSDLKYFLPLPEMVTVPQFISQPSTFTSLPVEIFSEIPQTISTYFPKLNDYIPNMQKLPRYLPHSKVFVGPISKDFTSEPISINKVPSNVLMASPQLTQTYVESNTIKQFTKGNLLTSPSTEAVPMLNKLLTVSSPVCILESPIYNLSKTTIALPTTYPNLESNHAFRPKPLLPCSNSQNVFQATPSDVTSLSPIKAHMTPLFYPQTFDATSSSLIYPSTSSQIIPLANTSSMTNIEEFVHPKTMSMPPALATASLTKSPPLRWSEFLPLYYKSTKYISPSSCVNALPVTPATSFITPLMKKKALSSPVSPAPVTLPHLPSHQTLFLTNPSLYKASSPLRYTTKCLTILPHSSPAHPSSILSPKMISEPTESENVVYSPAESPRFITPLPYPNESNHKHLPELLPCESQRKETIPHKFTSALSPVPNYRTSENAIPKAIPTFNNPISVTPHLAPLEAKYLSTFKPSVKVRPLLPVTYSSELNHETEQGIPCNPLTSPVMKFLRTTQLISSQLNSPERSQASAVYPIPLTPIKSISETSQPLNLNNIDPLNWKWSNISPVEAVEPLLQSSDINKVKYTPLVSKLIQLVPCTSKNRPQLISSLQPAELLSKSREALYYNYPQSSILHNHTSNLNQWWSQINPISIPVKVPSLWPSPAPDKSLPPYQFSSSIVPIITPTPLTYPSSRATEPVKEGFYSPITHHSIPIPVIAMSTTPSVFSTQNGSPPCQIFPYSETSKPYRILSTPSNYNSHICNPLTPTLPSRVYTTSTPINIKKYNSVKPPNSPTLKEHTVPISPYIPTPNLPVSIDSEILESKIITPANLRLVSKYKSPFILQTPSSTLSSISTLRLNENIQKTSPSSITPLYPVPLKNSQLISLPLSSLSKSVPELAPIISVSISETSADFVTPLQPAYPVQSVRQSSPVIIPTSIRPLLSSTFNKSPLTNLSHLHPCKCSALNVLKYSIPATVPCMPNYYHQYLGRISTNSVEDPTSMAPTSAPLSSQTKYYEYKPTTYQPYSRSISAAISPISAGEPFSLKPADQLLNDSYQTPLSQAIRQKSIHELSVKPLYVTHTLSPLLYVPSKTDNITPNILTPLMQPSTFSPDFIMSDLGPTTSNTDLLIPSNSSIYPLSSLVKVPATPKSFPNLPEYNDYLNVRTPVKVTQIKSSPMFASKIQPSYQSICSSLNALPLSIDPSIPMLLTTPSSSFKTILPNKMYKTQSATRLNLQKLTSPLITPVSNRSELAPTTLHSYSTPCFGTVGKTMTSSTPNAPNMVSRLYSQYYNPLLTIDPASQNIKSPQRLVPKINPYSTPLKYQLPIHYPVLYSLAPAKPSPKTSQYLSYTSSSSSPYTIGQPTATPSVFTTNPFKGLSPCKYSLPIKPTACGWVSSLSPSKSYTYVPFHSKIVTSPLKTLQHKSYQPYYSISSSLTPASYATQSVAIPENTASPLTPPARHLLCNYPNTKRIISVPKPISASSTLPFLSNLIPLKLKSSKWVNVQDSSFKTTPKPDISSTYTSPSFMFSSIKEHPCYPSSYTAIESKDSITSLPKSKLYLPTSTYFTPLSTNIIPVPTPQAISSQLNKFMASQPVSYSPLKTAPVAFASPLKITEPYTSKVLSYLSQLSPSTPLVSPSFSNAPVSKTQFNCNPYSNIVSSPIISTKFSSCTSTECMTPETLLSASTNNILSPPPISKDMTIKSRLNPSLTQPQSSIDKTMYVPSLSPVSATLYPFLPLSTPLKTIYTKPTLQYSTIATSKCSFDSLQKPVEPIKLGSNPALPLFYTPITSTPISPISIQHPLITYKGFSSLLPIQSSDFYSPSSTEYKNLPLTSSKYTTLNTAPQYLPCSHTKYIQSYNTQPLSMGTISTSYMGPIQPCESSSPLPLSPNLSVSPSTLPKYNTVQSFLQVRTPTDRISGNSQSLNQVIYKQPFQSDFQSVHSEGYCYNPASISSFNNNNVCKTVHEINEKLPLYNTANYSNVISVPAEEVSRWKKISQATSNINYIDDNLLFTHPVQANCVPNKPISPSFQYYNDRNTISKIRNNMLPLQNEMKTRLSNYVNNDENIKSQFYKSDVDVSIPLGNILVARKDCSNSMVHTISPSIGLRMWPSNLKLLEAKLELKFKDLSVRNFQPIVKNLNMHDLNEVINLVKNYIRSKYGDVIVVSNNNYLNNQYKVIENCSNANDRCNLLWPVDNSCYYSEPAQNYKEVLLNKQKRRKKIT